MKKIDKKLEDRHDESGDTSENKRRTFLKKAAYSAPVLLVLGQLAEPTKAQADSGPPAGPPNWGGF